MDQEPPVKRNVFLIAIVIFFNLIWLTLLFLSCQTDDTTRPQLTPTVGIEAEQSGVSDDFYSIIDYGYIWPVTLNPYNDALQGALGVPGAVAHQRAGNHGAVPDFLVVDFCY